MDFLDDLFDNFEYVEFADILRIDHEQDSNALSLPVVPMAMDSSVRKGPAFISFSTKRCNHRFTRLPITSTDQGKGERTVGSISTLVRSLFC